MTYRMLALDMDGTLLTSDKRVSARTRAALGRLAASSIPIAFSTGRNTRELRAYLDELPFIRYASLMSGAAVFDLVEGVAISQRPIDTKLAHEVVQRVAQEDPMIHVMTVRESVARQLDIDRMPTLGMGVYQGMFQDICTRMDDAVRWIDAHPGEVMKLNLYHHSKESRARTRERISDLPLTIADSEETALECSALGVSKAEGLRDLCAHLGISMDDVVAVGDAPNDLDALRAVGMPVAMGNATPEVRAVARLTVSDNDHDGIVDVIERLFS